MPKNHFIEAVTSFRSFQLNRIEFGPSRNSLTVVLLARQRFQTSHRWTAKMMNSATAEIRCRMPITANPPSIFDSTSAQPM